MKRKALALCLLLGVGSNNCAMAQASFTGAPTRAPQGPNPAGFSTPNLGTTPSARVNTPTNIPLLSPTMTGVILPTDTLLRNIQVSGAQVGPNASQASNKVTEKAPERVLAIDNLDEFLADNSWNGEKAQDWLNSFSETDAYLEESDFNEKERALIPILWQGEAKAEQGSTQSDMRPVVLKLSKNYRELHIFTAANQTLVDGETVMTAAEGTIVSSHHDYSTLHMGELSLDTGKEVARIATKVAGVKVEPESTCEIDYQPGKMLIVRALQGHGTCLKIKVLALPDRIIEVQAGEEICLDLEKQGVAEEEKIVRQKCHLTHLQKALAHKFAGEGSKLLQRMSEHLVEAKQLPPEDKQAHEARAKTIAPMQLIAAEDSYLTTTAKGQIGLLSGRFLICTESQQIIQAKLGDVYMQPHSVAAIEAGQGLMRVQCCTEPKSVLLVSKKYGIPMQWGMESLVVDHPATWEEAIPKDGIGRRAFEIHQREQHNFVLSDFHLITLLSHAPHLSLLRKPSHNRHAMLKERLLKTAASLQLVTSSHGQYQINDPHAKQEKPTNKEADKVTDNKTTKL